MKRKELNALKLFDYFHLVTLGDSKRKTRNLNLIGKINFILQTNFLVKIRFLKVVSLFISAFKLKFNCFKLKSHNSNSVECLECDFLDIIETV